MLNLPIVMIRLFLLLTLFFQTPTVTLTSPTSGDTLRGQVEIFGVMDVPNFASAELAFSYASDPAASWFTIQTFLQPVTNSSIAIWDTTTVTDGDYTLHLRVFLQDGTSQDAAITDLKIRNDVSLPAVTPEEIFQIAPPAVVAAEATLLPEPTLVFTQPTAIIPANPVALNVDSIYSTFGRGALIAFVLFIVFSLLLRLRKN